MEMQVSEYAVMATTKCKKHFSCLEGKKDCLCEVAGLNGSHRVKESESAIDQLEKDKRDISTKQAALTRLTSIINMLMEAGFDGMSFEQKRDFLLLLYPFGHKTYNIKVWRINNTDYRWEARGKLTDKTIEGFFQSADGKGKPVETTIQCIVDQPITEDEKKLLDKHGLTDKTVWYNSDIRKVRKLLNVCVTDNNFYDLC